MILVGFLKYIQQVFPIHPKRFLKGGKSNNAQSEIIISKGVLSYIFFFLDRVNNKVLEKYEIKRKRLIDANGNE